LQSSRTESQHKKLVAFYVPTKKRLKKSSENNSIHNSFKKYLGVNLIEEVKNFLSENYKTLKKEIREDTRKWKKSLILMDRAICRINAVPFKIPSSFFTEIE
jgi:RNase P/RNase MRP subunit POP5